MPATETGYLFLPLPLPPLVLPDAMDTETEFSLLLPAASLASAIIVCVPLSLRVFQLQVKKVVSTLEHFRLPSM